MTSSKQAKDLVTEPTMAIALPPTKTRSRGRLLNTSERREFNARYV